MQARDPRFAIYVCGGVASFDRCVVRGLYQGATTLGHPFEPLSYRVWGACIEVQRQLGCIAWKWTTSARWR